MAGNLTLTERVMMSEHQAVVFQEVVAAQNSLIGILCVLSVVAMVVNKVSVLNKVQPSTQTAVAKSSRSPFYIVTLPVK